MIDNREKIEAELPERPSPRRASKRSTTSTILRSTSRVWNLPPTRPNWIPSSAPSARPWRSLSSISRTPVHWSRFTRKSSSASKRHPTHSIRSFATCASLRSSPGGRASMSTVLICWVGRRPRWVWGTGSCSPRDLPRRRWFSIPCTNRKQSFATSAGRKSTAGIPIWWLTPSNRQERN